MDQLRQKFVLLLAHPEVSRSDFLSFCNWLQNGGLSTCIDQAEEIRELLSQSCAEASDNSPRPTSDKLGTRYGNLVKVIAKLLIRDANLHSRQALDLLADRLGYSDKFPDRISFERGLLRLIAFANPSTVLSAAQQIRNATVHNRPSLAWPLREQSDEASQ